MEIAQRTAADQARLWNGPAGQSWVEAQATLDRMFQPFEDLLVRAVAAGGGSQVLDVGCGTGATTLAVARRLGSGGAAAGIDISGPMITAARARAAREGSPATFLCADAQNYAFEPAGFDTIISRFGVMFFGDPVQAFANLFAAAAPEAALCLFVFRSAAENPFMTAAERAAAPLLPEMPARDPDGPGQFAFADPGRVRGILEQSGWGEVEIQPADVECTLPESELATYVGKLGPLGLMLRGAEEKTRARVLEAVHAAFEPYIHGAEVRFTAACWMVRARKSRTEDPV